VSAERSPIAGGAAFALFAAVAFGLTTPLVQRFGRGVGPFGTAAMLYAGGGIVALVAKKRAGVEAPLRPVHLGRLLAIAFSGAFLAPVALAYGLAHTSGTSASLLLNLEAVFTIALGAALFQEHVGRRVLLAAGLILAGATLLVLDRREGGRADLVGMAAVALAALGWALDNLLTRTLAEVDPGRVVLGKCVIGAGLSTVLGVFAEEPQAPPATVTRLILLGATGYGLSLLAYAFALRRLGVARTATIFAAGPFIGALTALALGEPAGGVLALAGGLLMIAGVVLQLTEQHEHEHRHPEIEHEHAHRHDDGHHDDHLHDPPVTGVHSHRHRHLARVHRHAHAPDPHHRHEHEHEHED
jgi:drug/metabolite transporter (DMT)-like permease